jgi:hypothetical protein
MTRYFFSGSRRSCYGASLPWLSARTTAIHAIHGQRVSAGNTKQVPR